MASSLFPSKHPRGLGRLSLHLNSLICKVGGSPCTQRIDEQRMSKRADACTSGGRDGI